MDAVSSEGPARAVVPSLVTALGILTWLIVVTGLGVLISATGSVTSAGSLRLEDLGTAVARSGVLAVAALISFSLIAPIVGRLSFRGVVVRSLVAGAIAVVAVVPLEFVLLTAYFNQLTVDQAGGLYDLADLDPMFTPPQVLLGAATNAVSIVLARLPLLVLAGITLWWWLRRKENQHGEA